MTRLADPDPAHAPHVMRDFPVPLRHMNIGLTASWRSCGWPKPPTRHTSWSSTARSHEALV
jgi:hypothetical protein